MSARERLRLIRIALRDRCRYEANWTAPWRFRVWHTVKCVVCVVIGRMGDLYAHGDAVEIATRNHHRWHHWEFGAAADWEVLAVPHGLRGWYFDVYETGYP